MVKKRRRHASLARRSLQRAWKALSKKMREKTPYCEACHSQKSLQCHHLMPKKQFPMYMLDEDNLLVLCRRCHFLYHHGHEIVFLKWLEDNKPSQAKHIAKLAEMHAKHIAKANEEKGKDHV